MRRMYPANLSTLVEMQVFMGRAMVCFCPNVSEFVRMFPNASECMANVCPNVCFGTDIALKMGALVGPDAWPFNSLIHLLLCHQALFVACVGHCRSHGRSDKID